MMVIPKDGDRVLYTTGGREFVAVVDGEAWALGSGEAVVNLRDLPNEYREYTGTGRTRVNAAAVRHLVAVVTP